MRSRGSVVMPHTLRGPGDGPSGTFAPARSSSKVGSVNKRLHGRLLVMASAGACFAAAVAAPAQGSLQVER